MSGRRRSSGCPVGSQSPCSARALKLVVLDKTGLNTPVVFVAHWSGGSGGIVRSSTANCPDFAPPLKRTIQLQGLRAAHVVYRISFWVLMTYSAKVRAKARSAAPSASSFCPLKPSWPTTVPESRSSAESCCWAGLSSSTIRAQIAVIGAAQHLAIHRDGPQRCLSIRAILWIPQHLRGCPSRQQTLHLGGVDALEQIVPTADAGGLVAPGLRAPPGTDRGEGLLAQRPPRSRSARSVSDNRPSAIQAGAPARCASDSAGRGGCACRGLGRGSSAGSAIEHR